MILNRFPVDPSRRKIVILSTPKTGNTWLRWLLRYAYGIQMVELPLEWAPGCTDDFLRVLLRTNISSRARALSDGWSRAEPSSSRQYAIRRTRFVVFFIT